jgi:aminopeptidase N
MRPTILSLVLLLSSSATLTAQQRGVDVLRYRFELRLPDRGKTVRVASTATFERGAGVDALRLDLLAPMKVSAATLGCGAASAPAPFTHDGRVVSVALPPSPPSGRLIAAQPEPVPAPAIDTLCVTVRYEGEPADGLVISTDSAGRWRAFGDNWPDRGRHWLAAVDHPSDKAIVEFVVDAPAALTVVANGTRRTVTDVAGAAPARRRTTYATAAPIPTYLMVIAAAPLVAHELGETACGLGSVARCVPQRVFTAPEQARYMPGNFAESDSIVAFFSRLIGPYPYEQLAHLQSSTRFGGMENAGAIFYADRLFRTPNGVSVELIAHETAHQWFGNAVTEQEWGHLWLSEGFATYLTTVYTEHSRGESAFRAAIAGIRAEILAADVVKARPVLDTAQTVLLDLLNANSYQKGGMVLHMLRREVGDSAFFRGIRAYWNAHRHGNGTTDALRQHVERESGSDLRWFFDQWLTRPGYAEVQLSHRWNASEGLLVVTARQQGRFGPYRLRMVVEVEAADGERMQGPIDIPAGAEAVLTLRLPLKSAPTVVRFDPAGDLLALIRTP